MAIFVILALAFVPASFLVYLVQDRANKCKHLQLVSGLNPVVYWLANYTWDMVSRILNLFSKFSNVNWVHCSLKIKRNSKLKCDKHIKAKKKHAKFSFFLG